MTDDEIISRMKRGDIDAFEMLITRYEIGLLRHICIMTQDSDMAQDICQDAFVRAYLNINKYDAKYSFSTWLYGIAVNRALDYLRKKRSICLDSIPEIKVESNLEEKLVLKDTAELVRRAVAKLPLKYQMVVSLYYWRQFQYQEIAEILNVPMNTVKTWLRRAKAELKEELDGRL